MAKFMYLFRSNPAAYKTMSPEQMQRTMKLWMEWKADLEKNGHTKQLGERLDGWGKVVRGKAAQLHPLMWIVAALFVVYFAIDPITRWLT